MAGRLVTIATFGQLTEAHTAKNALAAVGIQAALDNEQTSSLFGQVLPMISIRLVVREEDELRAVKVLDETFGGESVSAEELTALAEAAPAEDAVDAGQQLAPPVVDLVADSIAREREARAALLAACLGLVVPCVNPLATLFAIVMIMQAATGSGKLSGRGKRHLFAAGMIVLAPWLIILAVILVFTVIRP